MIPIDGQSRLASDRVWLGHVLPPWHGENFPLGWEEVTPTIPLDAEV